MHGETDIVARVCVHKTSNARTSTHQIRIEFLNGILATTAMAANIEGVECVRDATTQRRHILHFFSPENL